MKVEDLGLSPLPQAMSQKAYSSSTFNNRVSLFNFILTYQFDSQKLKILSLLSCLYFILQTIYISFWPHIDFTTNHFLNKYDYLKYPTNYEQNLTIAFFFYSPSEETSKLYLNSFIIFTITLFFLIISILHFCLYYYRGIINYPLLLCFNFFVQILCPILIIPFGFQIGSVSSKILVTKHLESGESTTTFVAIIILNAILYLCIIIITIMNNVLHSNSLIIGKYFLASFDCIFESFFMIFPSIILLFSSFVPYYNHNFRYIIMAFHVAFCITSVIWCFWIPFSIIKSNSAIASISSSMIIIDFLCFTEMITKWYIYFVFIGCFIAFYFLYDSLLKIRIKSILKVKKRNEVHEDVLIADANLRINSIPSKSHSSIQEFNDPNYKPTGFENMSTSKSLFALKIAILMKSSLFLEGKLVDLILTKVDSDQEKIQLGFLICYFPDFQPIFFSLLMGLKRAQYLTFLKEFQLYQLRCFDLACRPDSKIDEVKLLKFETQALEIHIKSIWQQIDSECNSHDESIQREENDIKSTLKYDLFSSLDRLSTSIYNCNSKWKTKLTFYPNNIELVEEYSKFLIICYGDYIGASEWKTIASLIKEGKTFKLNPASVSFLRAFPQYSKEIFPKKAIFVNLDDVDIHTKIDNISKFIECPELKFEYQRSTYSSYPISILVFLILSLISLLFIVIFMGQSLRSFKHFNTASDSINFVLETSLLGEQIAKCFINVFMDFGQLPNVDYFPHPDDMFNVIFKDGYSDRINNIYDYLLVDFSGDYKAQLEMEVEVGLGYLDFLHLAALKQVESGNGMNDFFSLFFSQTHPNVFYLSKNKSVTSVSNSQSILVSFFTYYFILSTYENYSFLNDTEFYDETLGGNQILDILEKVSTSVVQNNEEILKSLDYSNSTRLYIVFVVYVLFSCISIWVDFIFIKKHFKAIANSLCFFGKTIRQKAANSIILIDRNEESNTNTNNNNNNDDIFEDMDDDFLDDSTIIGVQSNIRYFVIIALVCSTLIHIILGCLIFSFHFVYIQYKKQIIACVKLVHNFSFEAFRVVELLYSIMAANVIGRILPSVEKKYRDRLLEVREKFLILHQARWSYSIEGDCGIKKEYANIINNIRNMEKCPNWPDKSYHELIACLSEESEMNIFIDLTDRMINNIHDPELMKSELFQQYFYFINANLYLDVSSYPVYLTSAVLEKDADYINKNKIFSVASIVLSILLFALNFLIYYKMRGIFKLLCALISRINPSDLITNNQLLSALFGIKNMNKKDIQNNDTSFLVQESSLPIVFIDRATLIEFVNIAFTSKFGYEANFIVGQPISTLINNESILYYIDKMKFFGSQKSVSNSITFKKENGSSILFDVTIIPIHEKLNKKQKNNHPTNGDSDDYDDNKTNNSFVNRIAVVFDDKSSKKNLERKCKSQKAFINKLAYCIYPQIFCMYIEGYLRMCAVCIFKLPNTFPSNTQTRSIICQYSNMYEILHEKLKIFPLLSPLIAKNEIFAVVGCKKNDPTELAIECLNFAFNVADEFINSITSGQFFAVIETGGEVNVGWLGSQIGRIVLSGELMNRALRVLDNASYAGTICTSKLTYEYLMQNDYAFYQKEIPEEICECNYIFAIEKDFNGNNYHNTNTHSESDNNIPVSTSEFFRNMKEEVNSPSDDGG